ncbi:MAG TPA: serine/threonine-protein kinase, partial [Polyangia bacterium]|nr:serine/threonine-protein kinase [Polyangia bacterium]
MTQPRGLAIGDRVGKYRITDKIGQGGMGEVFGAVHDGLGRDVAIKLLRARFADDESLLARFWQEAEAVSRIGHANIVSVYDFGRTEAGESYYVMERIAGESLAARLRREPPLSFAETDAIFAQLCRALAAVHARGIIHRDLKPDNVLLQAQASGLVHVKVVDFGVAKVRATPFGDTPGNLTAAGTLLGTPAYMAPEQIMAAQHVDGRADVYSLGAMLYQVLTGAPPFAGEELAVLMAHVRDEAPAPSTKRPDIAPALDAFVLRALAKEPEKRPDAPAFATELHALLAQAPAPATTAAKRGRPIAAFVAGGLVIVVAGVGALGWRARRAPTPTDVSPAVTAPQLTSAQRGHALMDAALAGEPVDRRAALLVIAALRTRHGLDAVTRALGDGEPEV